jgi:hypothetical protein
LNKFFTVLVGALIFLMLLSACGGVPFIAQNTGTETPTRRAVRPTFTPKPRATATEEVEPTEEPEPTDEPEPTNEPEPTDVPPTKAPTKRPAAQQPKPTNPPQPPAPPAPQFLIKLQANYLCAQEGVYKVIVNAKSGRAFAGGQVFAFFDQGGTLLQDGAGKKLIGVTQTAINVSIGSNCRVESDPSNPNSSNGELDVGDAVRQGTNPIVMRFVKSADDLTPISDNLLINFGQGGQYWVYTNTQ